MRDTGIDYCGSRIWPKLAVAELWSVMALFQCHPAMAAGIDDRKLSASETIAIEGHTRTATPIAESRHRDGPAIDLSAIYTFDVWGNARGGLRGGSRYLDNLDLTLTVDAERALGWRGATLFAYGLYNNGRRLSADLVGDTQVVSNIETPVRAARLYEAWVDQTLAAGRTSVKFGLYNLNSEFDTNNTGSMFLNSSHGTGLDLSQSGRNGPSIFPVTSLALRVDHRIVDEWLVRLAILDGVPGDPERPRRTVVKLGARDGALVVGELEYRSLNTKAVVGYWRYSARFEDMLATALAGEPVERSGNDGFYLLAERRLTRADADGARGLSAWVRLGFADDDFNAIEHYLGGGLVYTGPFADRPEDQMGFAVARAQFGAPYRLAMAARESPAARSEINIEASYRAVLTPWLTVQPDLQYVVNPGGDPRVPDALVIGLRTQLGF